MGNSVMRVTREGVLHSAVCVVPRVYRGDQLLQRFDAEHFLQGRATNKFGSQRLETGRIDLVGLIDVTHDPRVCLVDLQEPAI